MVGVRAAIAKVRRLVRRRLAQAPMRVFIKRNIGTDPTCKGGIQAA